jgi:uncharacterized protein
VTAFADSSAVVALYADERGSEVVRGEGHLVVSVLCRVEVAAAIWRKQRMSEVSANDARLLLDEFRADWNNSPGSAHVFVPIAATSGVIDEAASLCGVHGLRAYDAVQLASALAARAATGEVSTFLGFDVALSRAAAAEGFEVNDLP